MNTDQTGVVGNDTLQGGIGNDRLFGSWTGRIGLRARQKGLMRTMQQVALVVITATGLALAGCGSGSSNPAGGSPAGGDPIPPTPKSLDLSDFDDAAIMAGELTIVAGESGTLGGLTYSCPAGGAECRVTVKGDKTATYTGGKPEVMLTPPDDETPPDDGTPSTGGAPPSGGTPPATTTPSVDVVKLLVALKDRITGAGANNRQLPINQSKTITSAVYGNALGLKINAYTPTGSAEIPELTLTSVKLPDLHEWAGTRAIGSDARYEHTLVLYTDLEAPQSGTADDKHTVFGWWLRKDKQNGALAFKELAEGRVTANDDFEPSVGVPAALTGTATYAGAAAGMYVLKREGQTDVGGEWTAKATVTADFDDGTALGMVTGTITEFMVGSQSRNWQVNLKQSNHSSSAGLTTPGETFWTIDGEEGERLDTANSTWVGSFNNNKGTPDGANSPPTGFMGRFNTSYGTEGYMDGAFGAHKN